MTIILTAEQEKFIEQQIETGKYATVNDVLSSALNLLANQPDTNKYVIQTGEIARKKMLEKVGKIKKDMLETKNIPVDPYRQKLAEEFKKLCEETQALHADDPLSDEEIQAEIDAYRRGE